MDSNVYDSGNAGDSESWSSSEGDEQVIEISSHSRILISPRKTRGSNGDSKTKSCRNKRNSARAEHEREEVKSPGSQTSRRSKTRQPKKSWVSPRKKTSNNQPVSSNNRGDISGSESDESPASGRDDSDSADSLESDEELRVTRTKYPKKNSSNPYKYLARKALDDSMQSLGSPTTPKKEMAELKATLKKLARHDDDNQNSIIQKEAKISSATALHEYLTAATAVTAANQSRPTEYTKARAASFRQPRPNSNGSTKNKPKSMRESGKEVNGGGLSSFNSKLFSTPPPPFGGAGFTLPGQKSNFTGGTGGTQGSRAMLSALKALQDKITRLEEERESLKQQLSDAKLTARKREAELASTEKKYSYELGQTKESARAAYDALRCDREELKLQLVKSEERRKAIQTELHHFQELVKNLSAKSDDLQSQLQISESHRTRLRAELKESENNHQRVVNELQGEMAEVRKEQQATVERNELLEAQYQRESTNHAESRERLKDSEQTVASISQLNEKLVTKVMEATEAANQAMKKNKKLQQQIRPSTLLRPTAASRASAAAASEATSRRAANSQGGTVASSARTLKKKKTSTETAHSMTTKKPKKAKSTNNMTLLREANLGKEIPFLLGNSAQPSFSLIGNIQDAMRRSDTTYAMPTLLSGAPTTPDCTSIPRPTKRKTQSSADENNLETEAGTQQNLPPDSPDEDAAITEPLASTSALTPGSQRHRDKQKPPAINVSNAPTKTYVSPMQSQIMEDLHAAVTAAEKEFKGLNKRYKDLVTQMEENNRRGSKTTKADSTTSTQLSQALGPLLDELEAKAKQLNLLKQVYQQAASSTINPQRHVVISPEAVRRKTASLRVLNEYRQLESDSKSKGSGLSAPPYQLGTNGFFR